MPLCPSVCVSVFTSSKGRFCIFWEFRDGWLTGGVSLSVCLHVISGTLSCRPTKSSLWWFCPGATVQKQEGPRGPSAGRGEVAEPGPSDRDLLQHPGAPGRGSRLQPPPEPRAGGSGGLAFWATKCVYSYVTSYFILFKSNNYCYYYYYAYYYTWVWSMCLSRWIPVRVFSWTGLSPRSCLRTTGPWSPACCWHSKSSLYAPTPEPPLCTCLVWTVR